MLYLGNTLLGAGFVLVILVVVWAVVELCICYSKDK